MTHSFYFLFAAGTIGATGDADIPASAAATRPAVQYTQPASSGPVRAWLRNVFGQKKPARTAAAMPCAQTGPCAGISQPGAVPAAQGTTVLTLRPRYGQPALSVAKKYEDRIGHENDYSWVTGHLFYAHSDGGRWVIRYGLPDEVDKFGGSIVLAPGVEMRNYREGDLVCVYGDILDANRTSPTLGGALYRVNAISLVDRADP